MINGMPHWSKRYAWAPITVAAATLVVYSGPDILRAEGMGFAYLAAVFATTVFAGLGPGLAAAVLSLVAANAFFLLPRPGELSVSSITGQLVFFLVCVIVISAVVLLRRARSALGSSEKRFRTAQELSLDAFTVLKAVRDPSGTIVDFVWTYANPAAERLLGRTDLVGRRLLETLPGNRENEALFRRYVAVTQSAEPQDDELYYNADGIEGWFRNMAVKLDDGVAVSFSDITPRKRAEAELQELNRTLEQRVLERTAALERSQEALRQSERLAAIGEMITGISHESRNALQRSLACVQMLDRRLKAQPENQRLVSEIRAAHDELLRVYSGVVAYARPISLTVVPINIAEVWRRAWTKLVPDGARAELREDVDDSLAQCEADPLILEQVFHNIFDNALNAATDKPQMRISLDPGMLGEAPSVRVHLRDGGPGVSPEILTRILDPFVTNKTKGTGLGLAVVKRVVEAHGGTVEIPPQDGAGFEVVIELPRRHPDCHSLESM
ncbi:MAG: ATP-binding protein [FCB group bacterium]|jgi:PAS domain S-box-containing protein|nr:ATP-binding protein [FCB group bacterium]